MNKNESISVLKRFTVIMLALLMTAACLPVMEGRAVYADNKDLVNVTEEQAESLGIEYAEGLQFTKEDVEELKKVLQDYDSIIRAMPASLQSNNAVFNQKLEKMVQEMFS